MQLISILVCRERLPEELFKHSPTDQSYQVFETLSAQLDEELEQMNLVIQQDLARLNELLRELGLDPIDAERLIT